MPGGMPLQTMGSDISQKAMMHSLSGLERQSSLQSQLGGPGRGMAGMMGMAGSPTLSSQVSSRATQASRSMEVDSCNMHACAAT